MRFLGISPVLLLVLCAGCNSCPNYYGPGLSGSQYNSCIGNNYIEPPVAMGRRTRSHRPTVSERKQARDLKRWYRELNDKPSQQNDSGEYCPHCHRRHRSRQRSVYRSNSHDEWVYGDEMVMDGMIDDGYYDGQIIDGAIYEGGVSSGEYCPSCQGESTGEPTYAVPTPVPAAPPVEPAAPPVPDEPSALYAPVNEYYSPPALLTPEPGASAPSPVRQVSIPPVEQMLYALPVQE